MTTLREKLVKIGTKVVRRAFTDRSEPALLAHGARSRRAVLRLAAGASLAGLGLLAACSGGRGVTLQIGGDQGTARKQKFGSGRSPKH